MRPTNVQELSAIVRETREPFRIVGGGTWLPESSAPNAARLEMGAFSGIQEYSPDDLTMTVGAATTIKELGLATNPRGQWCPILPWGDDRTTVGAAVATAVSGPFVAALGHTRDLVLGLECVDGRGRIVRAGGRVVKNVAGFDLTRLMTGAWGTLGAITQVHLRLRARPVVDETYAVTGEGATDDAMRAFTRGPFAPIGCLPYGAGWLVRLGGNAAFVAAAKQALGTRGSLTATPRETWNAVRAELGPASPLTRWKTTPLMTKIKQAFDPRDVMNRGITTATREHTRES